ncbi:hypothetical protein JHW43_007281 [Diplocarpon mali]|nr:hypothetical protein JHW43_007281 [Diplocarpon mali]
MSRDTLPPPPINDPRHTAAWSRHLGTGHAGPRFVSDLEQGELAISPGRVGSRVCLPGSDSARRGVTGRGGRISGRGNRHFMLKRPDATPADNEAEGQGRGGWTTPQSISSGGDHGLGEPEHEA